MKILEGFNNDGSAKIRTSKQHELELLPAKGLGKSFDGVALFEEVIIRESYVRGDPSTVLWGYCEAEIERRAEELNADVNWMEIPVYSETDNNGRAVKMWFSPKKKEL